MTETKNTNKVDFYRKIERGVIQGACRYPEYWFCHDNTPKGSTVVELGGGRSALALSIMEAGNEVWVTEIDDGCHAHHLNLAKKHDDYHVVRVEGVELPIKTASKDVVISASSIEHFDPDNNQDIPMIKEVHRVLKPEGIFIITIPVFKKYFKNRYAGHPIHPPEKVYNQSEYKRRFLKLFKEEKKEFWKWSSKMPVDYIPHKSWIQRKDVVSTKPSKGFDDSHGLCVVLNKL